MTDVLYPKPNQFGEWKQWASRLVQSLEKRQALKPLQLVEFSVSNLPSAAQAGIMIYVLDESGGAVPAFSDGTDWRRVTDRAVVS